MSLCYTDHEYLYGRFVCYDDSARPPAGTAPRTPAGAESIALTSTDGARFAAFLARPADPSGVGVLLLPDNRGLRRFYNELALRLAEQGHTTIAIDYFGRSDGIDTDRPADFDVMAHLG